MKQQVLVIHGGDTFGSDKEYLEFLRNHDINFAKMTRAGWKENLRSDLGEDFEVILPQMPNKVNARYEEWKIMFEKLIPFLRDGLILVGHSMGGTFIAKYLAENKFPHQIKATFLIAAPFGNNEPEYSLYTFSLPTDLKDLGEQAGQIFIYHSSDDPLVPTRDADAYIQALPHADKKILTDRGHFNQERLPELVEEIKRLAAN